MRLRAGVEITAATTPCLLLRQNLEVARCKHKHNVECDQCQMLKTTLQEVDDASKSTADTKLRFVLLVVTVCCRNLIHATGETGYISTIRKMQHARCQKLPENYLGEYEKTHYNFGQR